MKQKLSFLVVFLFLFTCSGAMAFTSIPTYVDLNTVDAAYWTNPGHSGITGSFDEMTYYAETLSTITGPAVSDIGTGFITGLGLSNQGLNSDLAGTDSYQFTFAWNNLTGNVTGVDPDGTIHAAYTSGDINFYIETLESGGVVTQENYIYKDQTDLSVPTLGLINNTADLTDGVLVATVHVTGGSYILNIGDGVGSYLLNGEFSYLLDDFWYDATTGGDLHDGAAFSMDWLVAYSHGDNDTNNTRIVSAGGTSDVYSTHDSSIEIGVVPEPATLALFGIGLLGLAGLARKES
jgi:hypothetical protein